MTFSFLSSSFQTFKVPRSRNGSNRGDLGARGSNYSPLSTRNEQEDSDDETNVKVKNNVTYPEKNVAVSMKQSASILYL